MIELTSVDQFNTEVLQSTGPVLVKFYKTTCGPCAMMRPILEDVEATEGYKIYKADAAIFGQQAVNSGVTSVPTLVLFKDGQAGTKLVGYRSKDKVIEVFGELLA
jgi:thioredoxin 1